jgi:hypothetical protein
LEADDGEDDLEAVRADDSKPVLTWNDVCAARLPAGMSEEEYDRQLAALKEERDRIRCCVQ